MVTPNLDTDSLFYTRGVFNRIITRATRYGKNGKGKLLENVTFDPEGYDPKAITSLVYENQNCFFQCLDYIYTKHETYKSRFEQYVTTIMPLYRTKYNNGQCYVTLADMIDIVNLLQLPAKFMVSMSVDNFKAANADSYLSHFVDREKLTHVTMYYFSNVTMNEHKYVSFAGETCIFGVYGIENVDNDPPSHFHCVLLDADCRSWNMVKARCRSCYDWLNLLEYSDGRKMVNLHYNFNPTLFLQPSALTEYKLAQHFQECRRCDNCFRNYKSTITTDEEHKASERCKAAQANNNRTAGWRAQNSRMRKKKSIEGKRRLALAEKENRKLKVEDIIFNVDIRREDLFTNVWFADIECLVGKETNYRHVPFLVVLKAIDRSTINRGLYIYWGRDCMRQFCTKLLEQVNWRQAKIKHTSHTLIEVRGTLYFHNGSGYDANLVIHGLLQLLPPDMKIEILKRGSKILTFNIKKNLELRDFYLIIGSSLARLCADFKVPDHLAKKTLEVEIWKITSFEMAEKYKDKLIEYCVNDVTALEYVYKEFAPALFSICPKVLLCDSMTLAAHGLNMWKQMESKELLEQLLIPNTEFYNLFRSMYHGGRVNLVLGRYDSILWGTVNDPECYENLHTPHCHFSLDEEGIKEVLYVVDRSDTMLERLILVDVVSLYPAEMKNNNFPYGTLKEVKYEKDEDQCHMADKLQRIIRRGKKHDPITVEGYDGYVDTESSCSGDYLEYGILKATMFKSFYQVDMDVTREDLLIAFVIRKNEKTGDTPEQSLAPFRDFWITGIELFEALRIPHKAYNLLRIKKVLYFEKSGKLFEQYITMLFEIKKKYSGDKSSSMYMAAKLLMNALSGRCSHNLQKAQSLSR